MCVDTASFLFNAIFIDIFPYPLQFSCRSPVLVSLSLSPFLLNFCSEQTISSSLLMRLPLIGFCSS